MPWHVALGRYFMVYDPGLEPYDVVRKSGQEHSLAMVVHIDYGLLGTGKDCNGGKTSGDNEVHLSVDNRTFVVVVRWKIGEKVFTTDPGNKPGDPPIKYGTGRLYFDKNVTQVQQDAIKDVFQTNPSGDLEAFGTVGHWLDPIRLPGAITGIPVTLSPLTGLPATIGSAEVNIDVPAVTQAQNANSINLKPITNTQLSQATYRLINAEPRFRLGGQSPDLEGVTLAAAISSTSASKWDDGGFKGYNGPAQLDGQGEMRNFEWQGADDAGKSSALFRYFRATGIPARENIIRNNLLEPTMPFEPIGGGD
jgi:hypothetical protein